MSTVNFPIPVPGSGDGPAVDISVLTGEKTVILSGTFSGQYVILGSHNGSLFVPLMVFDSSGPEGIQLTFKGAIAQVKVRSLASHSTGVTVNVSGLSAPGNNTFTSLPVITSSGPQPSLDLGTSAYATDLNFMGKGSLFGSVIIEGSQDNVKFNPIGAFTSGQTSSLTGALEFSPLATNDKIRYVRANVNGNILSAFWVTVGGSVENSGGSGGTETLRQAYQQGTNSTDQTLPLNDLLGGKVVFDATALGFTDPEAVQVLVPGGEGAGFLSTGGMVIGPSNILIGTPGFPAINNSGTGLNIVIGPSAKVDDGVFYGVSIGYYAEVTNDFGIAIGQGASANGNASLSIDQANSLGDYSIAIGYGAINLYESEIVIGNFSSVVACNSNLQPTASVIMGISLEAASPASVILGSYSVVFPYPTPDISDDGTYDNIIVGNQDSITPYPDPNVPGQHSGNINIGNYSTTSGSSCVSIGNRVSVGLTVPSYGLVAIGADVTASLDYDMAIGNSSQATGGSSMALGLGSIASGLQSTALQQASALGDYSIAACLSTAVDNNSIAIGYSSYATGIGSIAILGDARGTNTGGTGNPAIGIGGEAGGPNTIAICASSQFEGNGTAIGVTGAVALGSSIRLNSNFDLLIGYNLYSPVNAAPLDPPADGYNIYMGQNISGQTGNSVGDLKQVAIGSNITIGEVVGISSSYSIAIGAGTSISGTDSIAIGSGASTIVTNPGDGGSIAIGAGCSTSNGNIATAVGASSTATDPQSSAFGYLATASGGGLAIGQNSTASTDLSVATSGATASGNAAIAIGGNSTATGDFSVTMGVGSSADHFAGIAIGLNATVNNNGGIAVGSGAVAGANEIMFNNSADIPTSLFHAASNKAGNSDLFRFDVAGLTNDNTTDFFLLIKDASGTISYRQVLIAPTNLPPPLGSSALVVIP